MRAAAVFVCLVTAGSSAGRAWPAQTADRYLITDSSIGPIRVGMTLADARRAAGDATFVRASDGDGAALVEISFGNDVSLHAYAGEDDASAPIEWSKKIEVIEAFSSAFHTAGGIHPGSLLVDAVRRFGAVREIVEGEIESRQFVTFERQPRGLTFRIDYTGVFAPGSHRTTRFDPHAKIFSIAVSREP